LPVGIASRFFELRQKRLRPVVAHPERYVPVIDDPRKVSEQLRRAGGVLLLDLCALTGKYGGRAQRTAEALLDLGAYYAACTDAHRPADVDESARAIARLIERCGRPADILEGRVIDEFD
jgi:protein-tyrosine phosphatase